MKKLCLILTVLYAFGANCSAQSAFNIAASLLTGDNSTFDSTMGNWTCNDNTACSIESESGHSGNYLKLTNIGAGNDYEKQMEYRLSGHTPTKEKRYVIKFWAKRNGALGNGQIKVLLQKNSSNEGYPQIPFGGNSISIDGTWTHYEYDLTANRGDYEVIKINFGNCGEVWIDDIEYGEYSANVAPLFTTNLNTFYNVGQGGKLDLTVAASGTPAPNYQWYKNTTNSTEGAKLIDGATTASYSVPTTEQGITYYYCFATNSQGSVPSNIAGVTVTEPVHATGVTLDKNSASVKQGRTITLTATVTPEEAANRNVTWSSSDPSVATVSGGVVTGVATGNAKITVTTEDGKYTASCTVTVTTSLPPRLIADFNDITSLDGIISAHYASHVVTPTKKDNMYIELISDPYSNGKYVAVSDGSYKDQEYCTINLPDDLNIKDYGILAFDICYPEKSTDDDGGQHESMNYKTIPISLIYKDGNSNTQTVNLAIFRTPGSPEPVWDTKMIHLNPLADKNFEGASNFQIKIGPINSQRCIYYLDNIRIKENVDDVEDFTQDNDLSDIWWKVEGNTLYIRGNGVIPDYTGNKQCPWAAQTQNIEHVVVSEGITGIGNYSVGNSQNDNVDITLHSIPEYFGENCLKREGAEHLTRTLHLELRDAEKPFIAKRNSEYFPKFDTAKYYRNVTSNYSTVCLPFPVAAETVTDAGVELFDFTSIKNNGEQYTLAFSKHSGDMEAGRTYLIKKHNTEVTLQNTDVEEGHFKLTPVPSPQTVTDGDTEIKVSMTGVFQPSVFGPNLGTKDAPEYAYGFKNEKFYMNSGNMSVRPMRGYFYGSQLYSEQQSGAKKMPKMFNFEIVRDIETHISSPDFIAEDFNIEEVYSPSGMKTESLNKGLNIIRTSTGRVLKVMVK